MMDDYLVYNPFTHEKRIRSFKDLPLVLGTSKKKILEQLQEDNWYFERAGLYVLHEEIDKKLLHMIYREHPHEDEVWRRLDEKYSVSNHGRVMKHWKSKDKVMIPVLVERRNREFLLVKIHGKGQLVARLVMTAFHDEPIDDLSVSHVDDNPHNNYYENLRVTTKSQLGKMSGYKSRSIPVELIDEDGNVIEWYRSVRMAAKENFMSYQTVLDHLNGETKRAAGLLFRKSRSVI